MYFRGDLWLVFGSLSMHGVKRRSSATLDSISVAADAASWLEYQVQRRGNVSI